MYFRLALGNVRKSLCDYAIYFTTITLGVASFYAFNSLAAQCNFFSSEVSTALRDVSEVARHLTVFLAGVLGFLMVYANNYLMRRRKRELGLYQLLGMRSSQISFILVCEMLIASIASLVAGFALGVLLSQLMTFVTAALFQEAIKNFTFVFSSSALTTTVTCYGIIFFVMLICNLYTLTKVKLSDLMQADRKNEEVYMRSLPASLIATAAGLGLVIFGYCRILHDGYPFDAPLNDSRWMQFLFTTGFGAVGTLLFFFGLSGAIFMVNRLWKRHYYRGLNMFTARQLASRVNTTSLSMGVISLVLFFAITFVTSGMALCNSFVDQLVRHVPFDVSMVMAYDSPDSPGSEGSISSENVKKSVSSENLAAKPFDVAQDLKNKGFDFSRVSRAAAQVTYRELPSDAVLMRNDSSRLHLEEEVMKRISQDRRCCINTDGSYKLLAVSLSDYNEQRKLRGMAAVPLSGTECVVLSDRDMVSFEKEAIGTLASLKVGGTQYSVHHIDETSAVMFNGSHARSGEFTIVLPDAAVASFHPYRCAFNVQHGSDSAALEALVKNMQQKAAALSEKTQKPSNIYEASQDGHTIGSYDYPPVLREDVIKVTIFARGVVAYFAVYVGFVFIVCCAAILAIQQLCSTADTALRYRLLSEIGCPRRLTNRSLFRQTAYVFALPFAVALCHSFVAMKVLRDFIKQFTTLDILETSLVCVGLFAAVYLLYFLVTHFVSRSIVNSKMVEARVDH